jgi:DNA repair exonuclease SbcCD ATPase subunit
MITSLRLKGFRRYADERLELQEGITFIDGENNAGKTTVFLAIEYALFGTTHGLRSPIALLQPGAPGLGVELELRGRDGKRYRLQRVHVKPPKARTKLVSHFTLKAIDEAAERYLLSSDFQDSEAALALKLQELTGISRRVFDLAVHVKQGEAATILDGDVRLDIALGITAASTACDELRGLALEDEQAAESLPTLEASLAHVEREHGLLAADDEKAKASITTLEQKIAAAQKVLEDSPLEDDDDEDAAEDDDEDSDDASEDDEDSDAGRPVVPPELIAQHAELAGRIARRKKLLHGAASGGLAAGAVCEHCGSAIDAAKAQAELAAWAAELVELDAQLGAARAALEAWEEAQEAAREAAQAVREAEAARRAKARLELERKRAKAEAELEAAEEALSQQRAALEQKATRVADNERELGRLRAEVASMGTRAQRAVKLRAMAAGFKELQEQLRAKTAEDLARSMTRIHAALTGTPEIEALTIDPVKYQVMVTPRDVGAEMPASLVQGGGHKLLLGLAFRLALLERLGPMPFALLDEPTYGLDTKRRSSLLERVSSLGLVPQILLITHQEMGEVPGRRVFIERGEKTSTQRQASAAHAQEANG